MFNQPNNLDRGLELLKNLPQAAPNEDFEKKLFLRLEQKGPLLDDKEAIKWIKWSVAALITLAVTNAFVLSQQTIKVEEIDFLVVDTLDEGYYYGQELLAIDKP